MAAIALTTSNRVEVIDSKDQKTAIAAVAITAGQPVYLGTAGQWVLANATDATHSTGVHIATRTVGIGEPLTAIRSGTMDGWVISALAYNAPIYLSDTDGTIATSAGTVSLVIGRVKASNAQSVGASADKTISFSCPL